ncbi:MAG TPA: glutamate-1-semialdehyde 2,1-aminomutase [Nitrospinota bacterium]|nr:glutamate-1-semialdehyde 2,1-aminomutase [Nitrospinota bacterium]
MKDSEALFAKARNIIPGGVNSPVRAFQSVECSPLFIDKEKGAKIYDLTGRGYIDYVGSWGPMIIGHAHPVIIDALSKALSKGTSYGAPTNLEIEMAELIIEAVPSIEMVRMVNSGTEATMSAIRVARGYTGRDMIIKLDGCYHGHGDSLLVKAGSGVETLGLPNSPGVPSTLAELTISLPFNNLEAIENAFVNYSGNIACIILEPIVGNMGVLLPEPGYLEGLRTLCDKYNVLLVFDEVMTGFRVSYGGAQEKYGVIPDLTTLGKIIGGGLPVGAYGGKREIMEMVAPEGPIYQAGTLSGNPLAMVAGIETLKILKEPGTYENLESISAILNDGLETLAANAGINSTLNRAGAMFAMFFSTQKRITDYIDAKTSDTQKFGQYFRSMLENGIYLAPSQFEAGFISTAHTKEDIELTLVAAEKSLASI